MNIFTVDLRNFTTNILPVDFEHFYKRKADSFALSDENKI